MELYDISLENSFPRVSQISPPSELPNQWKWNFDVDSFCLVQQEDNGEPEKDVFLPTGKQKVLIPLSMVEMQGKRDDSNRFLPIVEMKTGIKLTFSFQLFPSNTLKHVKHLKNLKDSERSTCGDGEDPCSEGNSSDDGDYSDIAHPGEPKPVGCWVNNHQLTTSKQHEDFLNPSTSFWHHYLLLNHFNLVRFFGVSMVGLGTCPPLDLSGPYHPSKTKKGNFLLLFESIHKAMTLRTIIQLIKKKKFWQRSSTYSIPLSSSSAPHPHPQQTPSSTPPPPPPTSSSTLAQTQAQIEDQTITKSEIKTQETQETQEPQVQVLIRSPRQSSVQSLDSSVKHKETEIPHPSLPLELGKENNIMTTTTDLDLDSEPEVELKHSAETPLQLSSQHLPPVHLHAVKPPLKSPRKLLVRRNTDSVVHEPLEGGRDSHRKKPGKGRDSMKYSEIKESTPEEASATQVLISPRTSSSQMKLIKFNLLLEIFQELEKFSEQLRSSPDKVKVMESYSITFDPLLTRLKLVSPSSEFVLIIEILSDLGKKIQLNENHIKDEDQNSKEIILSLDSQIDKLKTLTKLALDVSKPTNYRGKISHHKPSKPRSVPEIPKTSTSVPQMTTTPITTTTKPMVEIIQLPATVTPSTSLKSSTSSVSFSSLKTSQCCLPILQRSTESTTSYTTTFTLQLIPEDQIRHVVWHLLHGLDFLHKRDLGHFGLDPGGVVVCPTGCIKLINYGVPELQTSHEQDKMAPERSRGPITFMVDIWDLGSLILEMMGIQDVSEEHEYSPTLTSFVSSCLSDFRIRPCAKDLLKHNFLKQCKQQQLQAIQYETYTGLYLLALEP
eukprot:TRINITY_DN16337_c0_g1_i4.p1 TRINITY_DN16337_c0_g1~~TRINITY_DN16337_c0_g1_i4.p1  ORF type:complete len:937 (-),score=215.43 TRINITY_DN16337_c0_g1_i4:219-2717(-)